MEEGIIEGEEITDRVTVPEVLIVVDVEEEGQGVVVWDTAVALTEPDDECSNEAVEEGQRMGVLVSVPEVQVVCVDVGFREVDWEPLPEGLCGGEKDGLALWDAEMVGDKVDKRLKEEVLEGL